MRQTRCVRRACTGHVRRHSFFFYPYRPALRRLLLPLSSCRGRSRSKKRRRGARAREVRGRARSRVTILTVSRSCIGGATRENVVGGAGPGPSELSVCLSALTILFGNLGGAAIERCHDTRAVAVVAAAMLTQRWRLRPAHGASRPAEPLAAAVALPRRGCARRLRPSRPRSSRMWRDVHTADGGVQVSANPPGHAGKPLSIGCRPILLISISRAVHRTRLPV